MKFSRILALSMAAVAAFSFTACDSSSSDSVADLTTVSVNMGTQGHATDGSFLSFSKSIVYKSGLDTVGKRNGVRGDGTGTGHWGDVEAIFFTKDDALQEPWLFSPARLKEVSTSATAQAIPSVALANTTQFADLGDEDFSKVKTADDLDAIVKTIIAEELSNEISVAQGKVFAAKLKSGAWVIGKADVVSVNGDKNIGMQLKFVK